MFIIDVVGGVACVIVMRLVCGSGAGDVHKQMCIRVVIVVVGVVVVDVADDVDIVGMIAVIIQLVK